jgi:hypothetical protein
LRVITTIACPVARIARDRRAEQQVLDALRGQEPRVDERGDDDQQDERQPDAELADDQEALRHHASAGARLTGALG